MSYNLLFQKIQKWFIRQSLEHAKRTIFISISLTLLVGYGMRFLIIDDDLMKMLPKNLDSTDGLAAAVCHFYNQGRVESGKNYSGWASFVKQNPNKIK